MCGDNDGLLGPLRGHGAGRDEAGGGAGTRRTGPGGARAAAVLVVAWLPGWGRSRRHGKTRQELEVATAEVGAAWACGCEGALRYGFAAVRWKDERARGSPTKDIYTSYMIILAIIFTKPIFFCD